MENGYTKTEIVIILVIVGVLIGGLAFWSTIGYVIAHFIGKYW